MTYSDLTDRSPANFDVYDDYGDYYCDVIAGVSMEEYMERDAILSEVVLPQTGPGESSAEHVPADPRPSLPYARVVPAAGCPPAPLRDVVSIRLSLLRRRFGVWPTLLWHVCSTDDI